MITVNVDEVLKDFKGKKLEKTNPEDGSKEDLTLGGVCIDALMAVKRDEKPDGRKKVKRFKLGEKLSKGGKIELGAEEVVLIKERMELFYAPLVVGRVYEKICPEALKDE